MRSFVPVVALALSIFAIWFWLKSQHHPNKAIGVAQEFLQHINQQQFVHAFALTVQNNAYVGRNLTEFKTIASWRCSEMRFVGLHPFQSNGNRLRHWLAGQNPEMPEIVVEFLCPYPFGVRLRRDGKGNWKVFYFSAHAG